MGRMPDVLRGRYLVGRLFDAQVATSWWAIWQHDVPLRASRRHSQCLDKIDFLMQCRASIAWVKFVVTHAEYGKIDVENVNEY